MYLAAKENELAVDQALSHLIDQNIAITYEAVLFLLGSSQEYAAPQDLKFKSNQENEIAKEVRNR